MNEPKFQGYGKIDFLDMAFSASYLRRWHMVRVLRESTLSDHSYRVAQTFRAFFLMWQEHFDDCVHYNVNLNAVKLAGIEIALDHDLLETLAGDVPGHVKKGEAKAFYEQVEEEISQSVRDHEYFFQSQKSQSEEAKLARILVKLADEAESLVYAFYNQGLGHTVQDPKWKWVVERYYESFRERVESLDRPRFPNGFKHRLCTFVIDEKMRISPQHG